MTPIDGVNQNSGVGECTDPFTLDSHQSCVLNLDIIGSSLRGNIQGGPVACDHGKPLECYRPSSNNSLNIIKGSAALTANLSVNSLQLRMSVNNTAKNLELTGTPRQVTFTNTGSAAATNFSVNMPIWPTGTSSVTTCGNTLAAGASCTVTITPGSTATSDINGDPCSDNNLAPVPGNVTASADNAAPVTSAVVVLDYGCLYQGGYLYAVNDTPPPTVSISGRVAATADEPATYQWSTGYDDTEAYNLTDGFVNTQDIKNFTSIFTFPAVQQCIQKLDQGYNDWYLPAACEIGYDPMGTIGSDCGSLLQTIAGSIPAILSPVIYWSSTDAGNAPTNDLTDAVDLGVLPVEPVPSDKLLTYAVRCARLF